MIPAETEIKLRFPPGIRQRLERHPALQRGRVGSWEQRDQVTQYFDTKGSNLARAGLSVRVRTSDGRFVQTVKTGGTVGVSHERGEWEAPLMTAAPDPTLLMQTPVAAALPSLAGLRPVITTRINRATLRLQSGPETEIEVAIDHGAIEAAGAQEPVSELELELKQGDPAPMHRLALELAADLPLRLEPMSKAERGFRLKTAELPAPVKAQDLSFPADIPAGPAFATVIRAGLAHLIANLAPARAGDVEGIHQLRVAMRRLRAALILFQPILPRPVIRDLQARLRDLGRTFGAVRDWDVFTTECLASATQDGLDLARAGELAHAAGIHRANRLDVLFVTLDDPAFTRVLLELSLFAEEMASEDGKAAEPVARLAPHLLGRLMRKAEERGRKPGTATREQLHALRKAVKKLRYGIEFLAPLHDHKRVKRLLRPCNQLQDLLGQVNDSAATATLLAELSGHGRRIAEAAPVVQSWADHRAGTALRQVPRQWRKLRDADPLW